jgi:DNA-binding transcriptional ArsR family regulator
MARSSLDLVDPRIAKALSHPMRARILVILNERVASPNEIAEMIDERLPNVSYHVRALLDLDCIELVDTAQRRGAIEHYYRAVVRPFFSDRDWKRIPRSGREAISGTALRVIWDDVADAVKRGTFDARPDRHLTHNPMTLDDEGWAEVARVMADALAKIEKIESQSAGRLKKSSDAGIPARVVFMQFEAPADSASTNGPPQHAQKS